MKKKLMIALMFVVVVACLMISCKKEPEVVEKPPVEEPAVVPEQESEPEPELVTIPENENVLTGVGDLSKKAIGKRPIAVMVSNVSDALPRYGITQADVIFEIPVEGNLTRFMALYGDYTKVPKICPVRSCRYYFPALAQGFDAYYVHWGSDQTILDYVASLDIVKLDGISNTYKLFGRDKERRKSGMALEHTGYFDGTKLSNAIKEHELRIDLKEGKDGTAFQFCGMDEKVDPTGEVCNNVHIDFGPCTSTFAYDKENNVYLKRMNSKDHKDGKTGETLSFTNLFILETTIYTRDDEGHKFVDWEGGKDAVGYFVSNGKCQKITWEKKNESDYLKFYDEEGNELIINRGKSYIAFTTEGQGTFTE